MATISDLENNEEIKLFREYLQIPSVHPKPNYDPCVEFIKRQAESLELPVRVFYPVNAQNPMVILTWTGQQPELPAIFLNSHMDVVPVFPEKWTHPPFSADLDAEGKIFARGTQDMKSVGMQYLGAIRALKKRRVQLKRTVYLCFSSDEEMGGSLGMRPFVETDDFKQLNVGFALDEGYASPSEEFLVFYGERSVWRVYFKISGQSGHGSLLLKNTVGEKLHYIINKMMELRKTQVQRLENNPKITIGDVTTINLTIISGGVQSNVVPPAMTACFDVRLALDVDHKEFENTLHKWCAEAGGDIELEYDQKRPRVPPTEINENNEFWLAFKSATDELSLKIKTEIFPGGTDSRYIRQQNIPALGFSPINNTPVLLHDNDEFLGAETYLRGIEIYETILAKICNA